MNQTVIETVNLGLDYDLPSGDKFAALKNINLKVETGDFLAIMGPSGSGKTSLSNIIACLAIQTHGRYLLNGKSVRRFSESQLADTRACSIGFIFQDYILIEHLTALENVALGLLYDKDISRRAALKLSRQMLAELGLKDKINHYPNQLSGGQKQRVAIARAVVKKPTLILADEPAGALDEKSRVEVLSTLQSLNEKGATVILVTHSADDAKAASRVIKLESGRIVEDQLQRRKTRFFGSDSKSWEILEVQKAMTDLRVKSGIASKERLLDVLNRPLRKDTFLSVTGVTEGDWLRDRSVLSALFQRVGEFGEVEEAALLSVFLRHGTIFADDAKATLSFRRLAKRAWSDEAGKILIAASKTAPSGLVFETVPVQEFLTGPSAVLRAESVRLFENSELFKKFFHEKLFRMLLADKDARVRANSLEAFSRHLSVDNFLNFSFERDHSPRVKSAWALVQIQNGRMREGLALLKQMLASYKTEEVEAGTNAMMMLDPEQLLNELERLLKLDPKRASILNSVAHALKRSKSA